MSTNRYFKKLIDARLLPKNSDSNVCEICETPNFTSEAAEYDYGGPPRTKPSSSFYPNEIIKQIETSYDKIDTFIIFTTGIADTGIREFWFTNQYINHLLSLIPRNFTNIKVYHFDPDYFSHKNLESLNKLISNEVSTIRNPRYTESFFYNLPFPFEMIDFRRINHLLIDFAHIFNYDIKTGIPITNDHYKSIQKYKDDIKLEHLNSVYFGYVNAELKPESKILPFNNFIRIYRDGSSTNYIQRMALKGIEFHSSYPNDKLDNYINKLIEKTLLDLHKKKYGNLRGYDDLLRSANDLKTNIRNYYLDYLFTDHPFDLEVFKQLIIVEGNEYFKDQGKPLI